MGLKNAGKTVWVTFLLVLSVVKIAHAYIEPGSMSIVWQILMVVVAGGVLSLKSTWRFIIKIKDKITGRKK